MRNVYVVDSGFFIEGINVNISDVYTTSHVEKEIKSYIARIRIESLKSQGLKIVEIDDKDIDNIKKRLNCKNLSDTDISLIALCFKLREKGYNPVLITNDYSLQNIAKILGFEVLGIGSKRIRKVYFPIKYCKNCKIYYSDDEKFCKNCNSKLIIKYI